MAWIEARVEDWTCAIAELAIVALCHPQYAYASLQKSLLQEWQFVQQVVKGIRGKFSAIEESMDVLFLPTLLSDKLEECNRKLPMKFVGLALPYPVASSEPNFEASTLVCSHLLAAFRGVVPFSPDEHCSLRTTVTKELKIQKAALNESSLDLILKDLDCDTHMTLL
jgi:hypothetical protein